MQKIRGKYLSDPVFDPTVVAKASSAAEGLCKWIKAMEMYDRVAKVRCFKLCMNFFSKFDLVIHACMLQF